MFEPWLWVLLVLQVFPFRLALVREMFAAQARPPAQPPTMELRVDVQWGSAEVNEELASLHARLVRSGLLANGTQIIKTRFSHLIFRHREADGEHYIYVMDEARGRLAGYTVFNRLIEVNRRWDRFVRAPHSKYADEYQRCGIASAVYEWALCQGFCLISGARQSPGANALWQSLATRHQLEYVEIRDKCLSFLGARVDPSAQDSLYTRMLLLGTGWGIENGTLELINPRPPTAKPGVVQQCRRADDAYPNNG